jgi:hypothetical protein
VNPGQLNAEHPERWEALKSAHSMLSLEKLLIENFPERQLNETYC